MVERGKYFFRKIAVLLICAALLRGITPPQAKADYEKKTIVTENGAKLVVRKENHYNYSTNESETVYCVIGIEEGREDVYIPEMVDEYPIAEVSLLLYEEAVKTQKGVKHLHLSKNIESINEDDVDYHWYGKRKNIYYYLPNLSSITVDEANPWLRAKDGKVYRKKDNALLAIAPAVSGKVVIEKDVPEIAVNATLWLKKVTAFSVEKGNTAYRSSKGVLYSKNWKHLIRYPIASKTKELKMPKGVKYIDEQAFEAVKYLKKVFFSATVREVGEHAFALSSLEKVKFNKKLRKLGGTVFSGAHKLKPLKLPSGLREAEITFFPNEKLVIPARLGKVTLFQGDDYEDVRLDASTLVIKNPALDIYGMCDDMMMWDYFLDGKTVYAYKGSLPYKQIKKCKKKYKVDMKLKVLKGKVYKTPKATGKADTSWYSEEEKTFTISKPAQLAGMSLLSRKKYVDFHGQTIILKKNLDMKGYNNFYPIKNFEGTFDGNGKKIKNLKIYRLQENVGLFGDVRYDGKVKNLTVQGEITGGSYTGGIAGKCKKKNALENCSFKGKVFGYGYTGKLMGGSVE